MNDHILSTAAYCNDAATRDVASMDAVSAAAAAACHDAESVLAAATRTARHASARRFTRVVARTMMPRLSNCRPSSRSVTCVSAPSSVTPPSSHRPLVWLLVGLHIFYLHTCCCSSDDSDLTSDIHRINDHIPVWPNDYDEFDTHPVALALPQNFDEKTEYTDYVGRGRERWMDEEEKDEDREQSYTTWQPERPQLRAALSVSEFRRRLEEASNYKDVVRALYMDGGRLSDKQVDWLVVSRFVDFGAIQNDVLLPRIGTGGKWRRTSEVASEHTKEEWELAQAHYHEMVEITKCQRPVKEVIHMKKVLRSHSNKEYQPPCTVVYRCRDDTACCNETSQCGVKTSTNISRAFWEVEFRPGDHMVQMPPRVVTYTFVNHTECHCVPVKQLPACRPCPSPFVLRRVNVSRCLCACSSRHKPCRAIAGGNTALAEDELRCIKENRCSTPKCRWGGFDTHSGFCPCKPGVNCDRNLTNYRGKHVTSPRPGGRKQQHDRDVTARLVSREKTGTIT